MRAALKQCCSIGCSKVVDLVVKDIACRSAFSQIWTMCSKHAHEAPNGLAWGEILQLARIIGVNVCILKMTKFGEMNQESGIKWFLLSHHKCIF